jgi:hypothetical protein
MLSFAITANGNTEAQTLKPRIPEVARLVNFRIAGTPGGATFTVYSSINGGANVVPVGGQLENTANSIGIILTAGSNVFINTTGATNTTNVVATIEG